MKTAIYIEDGVVQLVLTPEGDFENNALRSFENQPTRTQIKVGQFYKCQGGWNRHQDMEMTGYGKDERDRSLIIRIEKTNETNPTS